jgi:hypothetical protein
MPQGSSETFESIEQDNIQHNTQLMQQTEDTAASITQSPKLLAPLVLWIDALCINQRDNTERNLQVARMGHIYRSTSELAIWLGKCNQNEEERVKAAFKFATYLHMI